MAEEDAAAELWWCSDHGYTWFDSVTAGRVIIHNLRQ